MNAEMPQEYLAQMRKAIEDGRQAGWDNAKVEWRRMAMLVLCETCLSTKAFTVNDFRGDIIKSGIKTHDNRAIGGLMATARGLGWVAPTGQTIPSLVGHGIEIQLWKSLIFQEEKRKLPTLF